MTAKIVSLANMKGGVGKTTIAVALAHVFAHRRIGDERSKVLLIDLDAQANASFWLCGDDDLANIIQAGRTIDAFLEDSVILGQQRSLKDYVHIVPAETPVGALSVIPCSPELRTIEREIVYFLSEQRRSLNEVETLIGDLLRREIDALKRDYDVIVFDSAPGISALTEAALRASDVVVVPAVPDFISNLGLEAFCRSVWWPGAADEDHTPWVVANMVKQSPHHRVMLTEMRAEAAAQDGGFKMFNVEIPNLFAIEEAAGRLSARGAPKNSIFDVEAVVPFEALAAEVMEVAYATR